MDKQFSSETRIKYIFTVLWRLYLNMVSSTLTLFDQFDLPQTSLQELHPLQQFLVHTKLCIGNPQYLVAALLQ